jgi:hypothetical protein
MQQLQMMTEITKSLPPELQPLLADFMVRATDLPFRHEVADRITKALGLDQPQDPNAPDPAAAQEQAMMQFQQQQMELQLQEQAAKAQKAQMDAQKAQVGVEAAKNKAMQDAATAMAKQQATELKMAHEEDLHAVSLDEQALNLVQKAQQQDEDHRMNQAGAQVKLRQSEESHKMNQAAAKAKFAQAEAAHKINLQAAKNKPKPATPKR